MAAHLQEAAIVEPVLADEDRFHRRLHVIVDAAPAGSLEEGERPIVRIKHHLLRLARIGAHEQHAAVAEPDMGDLHSDRHAVQHDDLVAPVELEGLPRREGQRHVRTRCETIESERVKERRNRIRILIPMAEAFDILRR
jgi:hypothetical protein